MGSNGWEYVTNFCVVAIVKSFIYSIPIKLIFYGF